VGFCVWLRGRTVPSSPAAWTSHLQAKLGPAFFVEVNALNARTTVFDDRISSMFGAFSCDGRSALNNVLHATRPGSCVVLALRTNDLKSYFNAEAKIIAQGTKVLINDILI
jgi:hypothetical protein